MDQLPELPLPTIPRKIKVIDLEDYPDTPSDAKIITSFIKDFKPKSYRLSIKQVDTSNLRPANTEKGEILLPEILNCLTIKPEAGAFLMPSINSTKNQKVKVEQ